MKDVIHLKLFWLILCLLLITSVCNWWMWRELKTYPNGGHLGHQLLHMFYMAAACFLGLLAGYFL